MTKMVSRVSTRVTPVVVSQQTRWDHCKNRATESAGHLWLTRLAFASVLTKGFNRAD